jgi:hypothetical protein
MTNTARDFGLCITVGGFSKVRYADIPKVRQLRFTPKWKRKQEYKELGSAGGVANGVGFLPSQFEA